MVIIKTNNDHIYVQFYGLTENVNFGCYLKCSFTTKPIIWGKAEPKYKEIYHFPNGFDLVPNLKIQDIFTNVLRTDFHDIAYLTEEDIPNNLEIEHFEIFRL